jgi:hypothetical protein
MVSEIIWQTPLAPGVRIAKQDVEPNGANHQERRQSRDVVCVG